MDSSTIFLKSHSSLPVSKQATLLTTEWRFAYPFSIFFLWLCSESRLRSQRCTRLSRRYGLTCNNTVLSMCSGHSLSRLHSCAKAATDPRPEVCNARALPPFRTPSSNHGAVDRLSQPVFHLRERVSPSALDSCYWLHIQECAFGEASVALAELSNCRR